MSVINQVLNELERRGANTALDEAEIRAVPQRKRSYVIRYVYLMLTVLVVSGGVIGYGVRTEVSGSEPVVAAAATTLTQTVPMPASAPVMAASSVVEVGENAMLYGKLLLLVASDEEPLPPAEIKKTLRNKAVAAAPKTVDEEPVEPGDPDQLKKISPQQRAENEFQKANQAVVDGRTNDALASYKGALLIDSSHKAARQGWVGVLLSLKRNDEAEQVLQRGLKRDPHDTSFAMLLARLQVERNDVPLALETLEKTLADAQGQADYFAFHAALLQRQSRHEEAAAQYVAALKLIPNKGLWLMGLGISQQALQRNDDARNSYRQALASNTLSPQLQGFVQQKLKELDPEKP
jgi:MSHA biogenesis protein MshN